MRFAPIITLFLSLALLGGCASKGGKTAADGKSGKAAKAPAAKVDPYSEGSTLYTLTNLHPDPAQYKLYSSNFLQAGFIPRCSAVQVVDKNKKRLVFSVKGVKYNYDFNSKSNPEGFDTNLKQYFGKSCSSADVTKLSGTDQKGVREGRALVGMSKQGVIYAIGYPTPNDTKSSLWVYFKNRFNRMNVEFNGSGTVKKVTD